VAGAGWLGRRRIELAECESTNDEAARLARGGAEHGTIVIAHAQRAGRGQAGRTWASPPGLGLYLSAVVRPPLPLERVPPMTLAIGIGVCDAARAAGADARLKWPNDVLAGGRKLAGILVEAQSQGSRLDAVIVGIGVNLGGELPPELAGRATTLAAAGGRPVDRAAFTDALLAEVERWIDRYVGAGLAPGPGLRSVPDLPSVIDAWHERMAPGLSVRAISGSRPLVGEAVGLADDGALLVRDADGALHRVRSGEVDVIGVMAPAEPAPGPC